MDALERIFRSLDYPPRLKKKSWKRRMKKRTAAKVAERSWKQPRIHSELDDEIMQKFRDRQQEYEQSMMRARSR